MLTASSIRALFFDFFKSKGHQIVPSAPIVIKDDPTLLFTNAGMNQFKEYFLGNKIPPYTRVANSQKCLRVSGKHNDLEEVGKDTYHHTMFEMLGNWSFGDYFKEEAIAWSWELLTQVYKIPADRIYVTIFKGDPKEGLSLDTESEDIWKRYLPQNRILAFGKKDNFWEMGETGPCGPCSEIHIDCRNDADRQKIDGANLVNQDNPLVIEIWNNVFIQYNRLKNGSLEALPQKHVDTGMGLERLVRVIQLQTSNYDTDLFEPIFKQIQALVGAPYTQSDSYKDIAIRVIADHIRAICFTIADGQLPSNTGAGYVIRRILRRAVRYYYSHLNTSQPLLHNLVDTISKLFKDVFPEVFQQKSLIAKIVLEEEQNFLKTISTGIKKLEQYLINNPNKTIDGNTVFELYDTYGFPADLTKIIAQEKNCLIDEQGFENAMIQQKNRSRQATKIDTSDWTFINTQKSNTPFVGYDKLEHTSHLIQYRTINQKNDTFFQWVLSETPFYAESGGQVGDTGTLSFGNDTIDIIDTKKENDLIIHFSKDKPLHITSIVTASVNATTRQETAKHHSATHLLHAALKQILGPHTQQKGAYLCQNYLRFDFAHFEKISDQQLQQIESLVNQKIKANIPVSTQVLPKETAIQQGANALFGEKYGDIVRMVTIDSNFSIELCGGTHIQNTSQIQSFKIKTETSVAAGIRRIEALCGNALQNLINNQLDELKNIKLILQNPTNTLTHIQNLINEKKDLNTLINLLENAIASNTANAIFAKKRHQEQSIFICEQVHFPTPQLLKKTASLLKSQIPANTAYAMCLFGIVDNTAHIFFAIDENTSTKNNIDLNQWSKNNLIQILNPKGGGQKHTISLISSNTSAFFEVQNLFEKTFFN